MKRGAALSAFCLSFFGALNPCWAQQVDAARETEAILGVVRSTTEAFNDHDAKRFVSCYTPTATLVTVRGERMTGAAEIERTLSSIFATRAKNAHLQTIDTSITFLTPDVAIAHVLNEMTGVLDAAAKTLPPPRELSIRVFQKSDGI